MKKLFLVLLFLTSIFSNPLFAQQFILSGKIVGQEEGYIYLNFLNKNEASIIDSAKIREGSFVFRNNICYPHWATIYRMINNKKEDKVFFIEPDEMNIILETNKFDSAVVSGSKTENEFSKIRSYESGMKKSEAIIRSRLSSLLLAQKDTTTNLLNDTIAFLRNEQERLQKEINRFEYEYIADHPISYASVNLLWGHMEDLSLDSLKLLFLKLNNSVITSVGGKHLTAFINSSEGGNAPDFSAKDINNKLLSLSSFKSDKYVLLDFWASWCVPCRENNPDMVSLYNKYHSKGLEIIGISRDREKDVDKWKTAVLIDGIDVWYQLRETGKIYPGDISIEYAVNSIPVKILIDKTGKVLYRDNKNNKESKRLLDEKLIKIFGF